jgi:Uma2 family endonuclease
VTCRIGHHGASGQTHDDCQPCCCLGSGLQRGFLPESLRGVLISYRIGGELEGAPDLVIEILSPSSRRTDVIMKSALYTRFGVQHYWIVDPDIDRIEVYRLADRAYQLVTSAQAPAELMVEEPGPLRLPLAEIFS